MATKLPTELTDAARKNKIVPFVGAGVSKKSDPSHFPNWSQLLDGLVDLMLVKGVATRKECADYKELVKSLKYGLVAERVKATLTSTDFEGYLTDNFVVKDTSGLDLSLQQEILNLSASYVITTNFDHLLDDAYARKFRQAPTIYNYLEPGPILVGTTTPDNPAIYKIHGDIKDVHSVILCDNDYRKLIHDRRAYENSITQTFNRFTILFIGFSLQDREVLHHLERIRFEQENVTRRHFALLPKNELSDPEIRYFSESFGVEVVSYDPRNSHEELVRIIKRLVKRKGA